MDDQDFLEANEALDFARQNVPFRLNFTSDEAEFGVFPVGNVGSGVSTVADPAYEQFLADVWVGIVLTLMVLSCVCFMCTCLVYHKIREWKTRALQSRHSEANLENGLSDLDLPSYTVASGLPTYDEALEQLKKCHPTHQSYQTSQEVCSKLPVIKEENPLGGSASSKTHAKPSGVSQSSADSSSSVLKFFKGSRRKGSS